jgi:hypothetical protein
MATGEGAAFLGAAGAVLIAVGIARVSLGQTQKSLPGWQAFSFLTLYLQYIKWGYKICQICWCGSGALSVFVTSGKWWKLDKFWGPAIRDR